MTGIRLRHLTFTGPHTKSAELKFDDGLNIIYGASNTGKSFTSKAILFMLGASKSLPETEEIVAYDAAWLGLTLSNNHDVTLYRATRGGHFRLYEGLVKSGDPEGSVVLRQQHDSKRRDTVSHLLLDAMGVAGKRIVRDGNGAKDALSIHLLSPYSVVSEEDIIAEKSPVLTSGAPTERTFEQNLFKFLITGIDDSAAVTVPKSTERKVAKAAKVALMDEMISQLDAELGNDPPDEKETEQQLERLNQSANDLFSRLEFAQKELDSLITERRNASDRRNELVQGGGELDLTLQRFEKLQAVYSSDLQRLQSIEEGGYVLAAMADTDCPVCGAPPDAQKHKHAAEEIAMAHKAAAAEARKIEREQLELAQTIASLEAESEGLGRTIALFTTSIEGFDRRIGDARPIEASLRENYETYALKREEIVRILVSCKGTHVRVGISAPQQLSVDRNEVYQRKRQLKTNGPSPGQVGRA